MDSCRRSTPQASLYSLDSLSLDPNCPLYNQKSLEVFFLFDLLVVPDTPSDKSEDSDSISDTSSSSSSFLTIAVVVVAGVAVVGAAGKILSFWFHVGRLLYRHQDWFEREDSW